MTVPTAIALLHGGGVEVAGAMRGAPAVGGERGRLAPVLMRLCAR
jgi:hypothetical protein